MAQSIILTGPNIVLYINNKLYKEVQSISLSVDYGEQEIYGIDSPYPQEIAPTRITVRGTIRGLRIKNSGGIQAKNMRPTFVDSAASPYVSIRIHDITTSEDIILIPNCKITSEAHTIETKRTYKLDCNFIGQMPLWALDRQV